MKKELFSVLETFGYPVFLQGTLNEDDAYPDSFITYWTDDSEDISHYDDDTTSYAWYFSVTFYSNAPAEEMQIKAEEIRQALKKAGFMPQGKGMDAISDEPTHTAWQMDFIKIEY